MLQRTLNVFMNADGLFPTAKTVHISSHNYLIHKITHNFLTIHCCIIILSPSLFSVDVLTNILCAVFSNLCYIFRRSR